MSGDSSGAPDGPHEVLGEALREVLNPPSTERRVRLLSRAVIGLAVVLIVTTVLSMVAVINVQADRAKAHRQAVASTAQLRQISATNSRLIAQLAAEQKVQQQQTQQVREDVVQVICSIVAAFKDVPPARRIVLHDTIGCP